MTTSRKHLCTAFWATLVVVVALVAYPLSFGPACWAVGRAHFADQAFRATYRPLVWIFQRLPPQAQSAAQWYVDLWLPPGLHFIGRGPGVWFIR